MPPAGPGGQFLFVVAGSVLSEGGANPPETVGWRPPGSGGWTGTAGSAGARLLVLRHPRPSGPGPRPASSDPGAERRPAPVRKDGTDA